MTKYMAFPANDLIQFRTVLAQKCAQLRLWIFPFLLLAISVQASNNWYVVPGGAGTQSGANWSSASDISGIPWSKVGAGDTIWLAGGTYKSTMAVGASGAAGNYIYIKRVLSTDSVATNAGGWNSSFDSQVVIALSGNGDCLSWNGQYTGSHVWIDGRVDSGISCQLVSGDTGSDSAVVFGNNSPCNGQIDVVLTNIDMLGGNHTYGSIPSSAPSKDFSFGINTSGASPGGGFGSVTNIVLSHCRLHGGLEAVTTFENVYGIIFDHCYIYDTGDSDPSHHNDVFELNNTYSMVVRYCIFWNDTQFMFFPLNADVRPSPIYMYGNVFSYPAPVDGTLVFEMNATLIGSNTYGPMYWYNNTFYGWTTGILNYYNNMFSTTVTANNLFVNNTGGLGGGGGIDGQTIGTWKYNYANNNILDSATGNINNSGVNPLSDITEGATGTWMIVSNIGSLYPRNKGTVITNVVDPILGVIDFSKDLNGNTRGTDGAWDIGAVEYVSISTNSVIKASRSNFNNFGSVLTNTVVPLIFTVSNTSAGTISGSVTVATPNSNFQVASGSTYVLSGNQYQTVIVIVSPTVPGLITNTIVINGGGTITIPVSGTAVNSSVPATIEPITVVTNGGL